MTDVGANIAKGLGVTILVLILCFGCCTKTTRDILNCFWRYKLRQKMSISEDEEELYGPGAQMYIDGGGLDEISTGSSGPEFGSGLDDVPVGDSVGEKKKKKKKSKRVSRRPENLSDGDDEGEGSSDLSDDIENIDPSGTISAFDLMNDDNAINDPDKYKGKKGKKKKKKKKKGDEESEVKKIKKKKKSQSDEELLEGDEERQELDEEEMKKNDAHNESSNLINIERELEDIDEEVNEEKSSIEKKGGEVDETSEDISNNHNNNKQPEDNDSHLLKNDEVEEGQDQEKNIVQQTPLDPPSMNDLESNPLIDKYEEKIKKLEEEYDSITVQTPRGSVHQDSLFESAEKKMANIATEDGSSSDEEGEISNKKKDDLGGIVGAPIGDLDDKLYMQGSSAEEKKTEDDSSDEDIEKILNQSSSSSSDDDDILLDPESKKKKKKKKKKKNPRMSWKNSFKENLDFLDGGNDDGPPKTFTEVLAEQEEEDKSHKRVSSGTSSGTGSNRNSMDNLMTELDF